MGNLKKLLTGEFEITTKAKKHPKIIFGVKAIVKNNDKYLIVQRSATDRHSPLKWEFPGGSFEKQDTNLTQTLKRELYEETGLKVSDISKSCFLYLHNIREEESKVYKNYKRLVAYYVCSVVGKVKLSKEHKNVKWVEISDFEKYSLTKEAAFAVNNLKFF